MLDLDSRDGKFTLAAKLKGLLLMQITKHFKRSELECPCCKAMEIPEGSLKFLEYLRDIVDRPFILNSAYRCEVQNTAVDGFKNSFHKKGMAFDISTKAWNGEQKAKLVQATLNYLDAGVGLYRKFIHVDLGGKRLWVGE